MASILAIQERVYDSAGATVVVVILLGLYGLGYGVARLLRAVRKGRF